MTKKLTCHQLTREEWIALWPIPDNAVLTTTRLINGRYIILYYPNIDRYVLMDKTGTFKIPSQLLQDHFKSKMHRHLMPTNNRSE